MLDSTLRILLVAQNRDEIQPVGQLLHAAKNDHVHPFSFVWISTICPEEGLIVLATEKIDVVLLDLSLSENENPQILHRFCLSAVNLPIVVINGTAGGDMDVQAVRSGVQDCLVKSQLNSTLLTQSLLYAVERKKAQDIDEASVLYQRLINDINSGKIQLIDMQKLSVSIGCAIWTSNSSCTLAMLVSHADAEMYKQKTGKSKKLHNNGGTLGQSIIKE